MRLVSVSIARSIWLVPFEEINPTGFDLIPLFLGIRQRYGFQKWPKLEDLSTGAPTGFQFGSGSMKLPDGTSIEIASFTIFKDGLVADTRHATTSSDIFLNDVLTFLAEKHRLIYEAAMVREKNYLSEVVVSAEVDLTQTCEKVSRFTSLLSTMLGEQFSATSFRFGTPPTGAKAGLSFTFEYRSGLPFDHKRYFSQAPCTTDQHVKLLNEFASIMTES
jgi:hypothetical protein